MYCQRVLRCLTVVDIVSLSSLSPLRHTECKLKMYRRIRSNLRHRYYLTGGSDDDSGSVNNIRLFLDEIGTQEALGEAWQRGVSAKSLIWKRLRFTKSFCLLSFRVSATAARAMTHELERLDNPRAKQIQLTKSLYRRCSATTAFIAAWTIIKRWPAYPSFKVGANIIFRTLLITILAHVRCWLSVGLLVPLLWAC